MLSRRDSQAKVGRNKGPITFGKPCPGESVDWTQSPRGRIDNWRASVVNPPVEGGVF